ncbi:MAG: hypothetical protein GC206_03680 [Alphaproteobacteria bacterium]|nr:hypothetical protein [Alphaproteobacteria bacterium]
MKLAAAAARRFVDKPDGRAALVYGPNRAAANDAARAIAAALVRGGDDPYALTKLSEDEIKKDKAALGDALAAQSLLGDVRLVWARIEGAGADDAILAALGDIEGGAALTFLLVEAGDLGGGAKMVKAFEAAKSAAAMAFYDDSEAERGQFARGLLKDEGVTLTREAGEALIDLLPADRGLIRREVEKIAAFAHGRAEPMGLDDLTTLLPDAGYSALDEAVSAATDGRGAAAMEALARIDALSGVSAIKALERKLMRLLEARGHMDRGASPIDAAGKLRPPVFWKERDAFQAQLRAWSTPRILRALDALWAAEIAAKSAQSPQALLAADAFQKVSGLLSAQAP